MFNLSFYVVCWLSFFLLCLPVIFSGLLAVALDNDKQDNQPSRLSTLSSELDEYANNKEKLKALLDEFLKTYKTYPKDGEEYSLWLDIISRFAVNMNLMEVDEVVNFQDTLESANPESKPSIKEAIGKALQKRENKQK
ncbi:hypothetical protein LS71_000590 [Helicobacter jaachi]|uniref:Uncharacterized protein n=1 Tax=Helicobacter jaachi TaxID=1677920 RepID=A0A4U8TF00_9HELI|nr:hypothetical protein [Helicobacter jaachi]TLD97287.1 hypothetical protein LS71_000590 [Helicobacter jaachi]